VSALNDRLSALERQMADILRQSEENGHRLSTIEADIAKARSDQEQRISALETKVAQAATAVPPAELSPTPSTPAPKPATPSNTKPQPGVTPLAQSAEPTADPAEEAYSEGFRLWNGGQYDQAIAKLRAFVAAYPKHRRVSYANNLIGRAYLDSNRPGPAAEALLANYRQNPSGERAQDSLYYLGQAVMQLGQPGQACKAYAELEDVYQGKIRADVAKLLPPAKAQAGCN
jgi:TolA-binding protein